MIKLLTAILFGLSANLDNLVIGVAFGVKNIKIKFIIQLIIASISTVVTFLSMVLGIIITKFIPLHLTNIIGSVSIICLGLYFSIFSIKELITPKHSNEVAIKNIDSMLPFAKKSDKNSSGDICISEAIYVSLALSINNIATGIAVYIAGVNIFMALGSTFIFSFLFLSLGLYFGRHYLGKILGKIAPLVAGLLLVMLGIIEIVISL